MQHRKEKPHAQFAPEKVLAEPDQQGGHRRMVEISPCEVFSEHMVIRFVVGQFGKPGLQEVAHPPHAEPQSYQAVGAERSISLFERCLHTSDKGSKIYRFCAIPVRKRGEGRNSFRANQSAGTHFAGVKNVSVISDRCYGPAPSAENPGQYRVPQPDACNGSGRGKHLWHVTIFGSP